MKNSVKTLIASATFLTTFFVLYFTLSLVGIMFGETYTEVIGNPAWFFIYAMFGIPVSGCFAAEVHSDL
jgi:hypothetical protein